MTTQFSALKEKEQELQDMLNAGLHIGHKKAKGHPRMKPFVLTTKNSIQIINTEKTYDYLKTALDFIYRTVADGKNIVFVGTTPSSQEETEAIAKACDMPHITNRWIGGTLTNFPTILKRIEAYLDLENKKNTGALEKYTKKEKLLMSQKLEKLSVKFGGIKTLKKLPDVIFVVDINKHKIVVSEAKRKSIPVVGIVDTDSNPSKIAYPIPANDNARPAIKYILEKVKETILAAKKEAIIMAKEKEKKPEPTKTN